jgi:hypothetical protein
MPGHYRMGVVSAVLVPHIYLVPQVKCSCSRASSNGFQEHAATELREIAATSDTVTKPTIDIGSLFYKKA